MTTRKNCRCVKVLRLINNFSRGLGVFFFGGGGGGIESKSNENLEYVFPSDLFTVFYGPY